MNAPQPKIMVDGVKDPIDVNIPTPFIFLKEEAEKIGVMEMIAGSKCVMKRTY